MSENIYPAKVIHVQDYNSGDHNQVIINRGSEHGIKEGQVFLIYALGDELKDPESGESLGRLEIVRGQGYATHVQPKMTTITSKNRKEYSYVRSSSFFQVISGLSGEENRREQGELLPFKGATPGDLAKPI